MKRLYWQPTKVSRVQLLLLAVLGVLCVLSVELLQITRKQPFYEEKIAASSLARKAIDVVKAERLKRFLPLDPEVDPSQSGLIGTLMSPITTNTGHLPSKQTAINPNFAAVMVHLLLRAGVEEGDVVAVGMSGSFPGLNIATYAALQTLGAKPIVISSTSGSQWGANEPNLTWPDMERVLWQKGIFSFRSVAVSRGGIEDRGLGLSKEGRTLLDAAIARSELPALQVKSYQESVDQRMSLYLQQAGEARIKAYINVGGGTSSVGTRVGKAMFKPGLNTTVPSMTADIDSVMLRFAGDGVPVLHMVKVDEFAQRYGFPLQPREIPLVGQGKVFVRRGYNIWLAIGALFMLVGTMMIMIRRELFGFRFAHSVKQVADKKV